MDTAQRFGRYDILMEMAMGGMATLYLARIGGLEGFEKLVALKRIHDQLTCEEQFTEMFLDEARIAAKIHHPNVATVFDMGRVEGKLYLAMEYVHGEPLNRLVGTSIRHDGGLTWHHGMRIVADAAAGLHAAHELTDASGDLLGVVHRDVSPHNILISYDGHVKVIDFGIAYAAERLASTNTGTVKGKAAYMSPEQTMALPVDRRSDVFSLGIILWEVVLQQRLFRQDSEAATLLKIRDGVVPKPRTILPDLPPEVEEIIVKALAYEPEDRYQTAADLGEALDRELIRQDRYVSAAQIAQVMSRNFAEEKRSKDNRIDLATRGSVVRMGPATAGAGDLSDLSDLSDPIDTVASDDISPRGDTKEHSQTSVETVGGDRVGRAPVAGRRRLVVAMGLGFAVGLAAVAIVFLTSGQERSVEAPQKPAPGPTTTKRDADPAEGTTQKSPGMRLVVVSKVDAAVTNSQPPAMVEFRVRIRPDDAKPMVTFRGRRYTGSLIQVLVPRTSTEALLEITAPGYAKEILFVNLEQDARLSVLLQPLDGKRKRAAPRWRANPRPRRRPMTADLVKTY